MVQDEPGLLVGVRPSREAAKQSNPAGGGLDVIVGVFDLAGELPVVAFVVGIAGAECCDKDTGGCHDAAHFGEAALDLGFGRMGEDGMCEEVIELAAEDSEMEIVALFERGLLHSNKFAAQFFADAGVDQPALRLDAEIASRQQVGHQEPAGRE